MISRGEPWSTMYFRTDILAAVRSTSWRSVNYRQIQQLSRRRVSEILPTPLALYVRHRMRNYLHENVKLGGTSRPGGLPEFREAGCIYRIKESLCSLSRSHLEGHPWAHFLWGPQPSTHSS